MPQRVVFTPAALKEPYGQHIYARAQELKLPIEELAANRLTGLTRESVRATYNSAKRTLAVVNQPPSALRLSPIPPSADWQFHVAEGCPAHCQYCYLAGSLQGPPVVRVFANAPTILANLARYEQADRTTSFEVSCYTDPLAIEHLTGSLAASIRYFGSRRRAELRWVSKFDAVDSLLGLPHNGRTHCRISVNAELVARRFEGGTVSVAARLGGLRRLALDGYRVGVVIAPIMPLPSWEAHYAELLDTIQTTFNFDCPLTFELITHRFTPGSKEVLMGWYPNTTLEMDESSRSVKRNKFGGTKYVYPRDTMSALRTFFEREIAARFPRGKILYWT